MRRALSRRPPRRSLSTGASYVPPLAAGKLPAYDHALAYLAADTQRNLALLADLEQQGTAPKHVLDSVHVAAWVNDPETRWRAENGKGDLSKPVYRHLAEHAWRKGGPLALLMQRVTTMNLTPDLLGSISPAADLQVKLSTSESPLEPGVFVFPAETREGVQVTAQVFHEEERLYTLLLIDPDVPDEASQSFTTYAHWLIPNIPLSSVSSHLPLASPTLPYIPPHPQSGTPYHRYTFLLLAQPSSLDLSTAPLEREGFSVRAFVAEHALDPVGVTFFREKWDRDVSAIYSDVLGMPEPKFAKYKLPDPYKARPKKYEP